MIAKRAPNPDRLQAPVTILGVPFDRVTTGKTIELIEEMIATGRPHYLVTANVDFLVQAKQDVELRRILLEAHLVLCDGTPLLWASRLLGNPLPERVAGADLVPLLIARAAEKKYRVFFLGASLESAERAVKNLRVRYPSLEIAGHYSPAFNKLLEMDHDEIKKRVLAASPDLLFVSFGCPKQEKWIAMHYRSLGVPVTVGVGATIDFLAGRVRRAPVWMRRIGAEWLFRLAQEPRRLLGRYARDLCIFSGSLLSQWWHLRPRTKNLVSKAVSSIPPPEQQEARNGPMPCVANGPRTFLASVTPTQTGSMTFPEPKAAGPDHAAATFQILQLPERLDRATVEATAIPAEQILGDSRHCLVNMSSVRFIDSTGIGLLIRLQKQLRPLGRQMLLLGPGNSIRHVLKLMGLEDYFVVVPDVAGAVQLIRHRARELASGVASGPALRNQPFFWQGEITAANADEVWRLTHARLFNVAENAQPELTIDLGSVRFLDSSGLGIMVRAKKLAQRHGTRLCFTGLQPPVRNVVQLARLEEFLLGHGSR